MVRGPRYATVLLGAGMERPIWLVLLLSLVTAVVAMACARARPGGSVDAGPLGPRPAGNMGVLTVRMSEEIDAGTCVEVWVYRSQEPSRFLGSFPARVEVPLDKTILVDARCPGFRLFMTHRVLTRANPEAEVTIPLEEAQQMWAFGYRPSELPREAGFIPVKEQNIGQPAGRVFEWISGPTDPQGLLVDERGDVWLFRVPDGGSEFEFRRRGMVATEVLTRMKALRLDAEHGEVRSGGWCDDCGCNDCTGAAAIFMYDAEHWGNAKVLLASYGSTTGSRRIGAAAETLSQWMLGVSRDARPRTNPAE